VRENGISHAVGGSAVGFGVLGLLAPRLLSKLFDVKTDSGEFKYLVRLAGSESLGLGINLLSARGDARRRALVIATVVDASSCALAIAAGVSGDLPKWTAFRLALVTGAVAVTAAIRVVKSVAS
jgi:hypothetical protein